MRLEPAAYCARFQMKQAAESWGSCSLAMGSFLRPGLVMDVYFLGTGLLEPAARQASFDWSGRRVVRRLRCCRGVARDVATGGQRCMPVVGCLMS